MSDWPSGRLADVLVPTDERAGEDSEIDLVLSVTERRGIIPQTAVYQKRVATEDVSKYKILNPLDIAYNPYLLWTNAVGQWLGTTPGVTSPVYECFRVGEGHEPRFWGLVLESGLLTPYFDATAVGSVQRRRRTTVPTFLAAAVEIPPLEVQRRIVDVLKGVDANLASLAMEVETLAVVLQSLLEEWRAEGRATTGLPVLGDLALVRSGPSWAAAEESDIPSEGATRVIKITNTKQDGSLDLTGRTYVTGLPTRTFLLDGRSLIVIRTNGNRERIGNVYRPSLEALGCAVSAFQFIVQARDEVDRDRIYWALRAPGQQAAMSAAASGTTGLGNLAAGWLKTQPIAELNEQMRMAFEDIERQLTQLRSERNGLRFVRTQLLQSLLSGAVEIPDAYDRLVDVGVA